jgi:predicted nucleic acid-binding protein
MQAAGLIDTGALLALLDRDDAWHERCRAAFQELRYPLATVFTIDRDDFETYRIKGKTRFRIVP